MKTDAQRIAEAKARIREVTVRQVMEMLEKGDAVTLLDVRDLPEVNLGKIPGAVHIARGNLESQVEATIQRGARVVAYCASGNRSALAADALTQLGYTDVASMAGGIRGWVEAGGDVE